MYEKIFMRIFFTDRQQIYWKFVNSMKILPSPISNTHLLSTIKPLCTGKETLCPEFIN